MIIIRSRREGFRRCGIEHPSESTEHKDDAFSSDEIEILENEPMLIVEHVKEPDKKETQEKKGPAGTQEKEPELEQLIDAGKKAIADGKTIGSGAPSVDAMADILGIEINSAQRDVAWQAIQEEDN